MRAPSVVLYTRVGCHLCDVVKGTLDDVRRARAFELTVVDVDTDPKLVELYGLEVPVVTINGRKAFKYRATATELEAKLERAETEG